jgi:uncharacterized membrane protein YhfC
VTWLYVILAHLSAWQAFEQDDDRMMACAVMFALCAIASAVKERKS